MKSPIFTNTPCKSTCLYNAPSMHTVEIMNISRNKLRKVSFGELFFLHKA